jgi:hypothetical protein
VAAQLVASRVVLNSTELVVSRPKYQERGASPPDGNTVPLGHELISTSSRSITELSTCLNLLEVGFLILRRYCRLIGPHKQLGPCTSRSLMEGLLFFTLSIVSHVRRKSNDLVQEELNQQRSHSEYLRTRDLHRFT